MMPTGLPMPTTPPPAPAAGPNVASRQASQADSKTKPFAGVLDEATPRESPVAGNAAATTASEESNTDTAADSDDSSDPDAHLPDQLLALLGGSWAATPPAAGAPLPVSAMGGLTGMTAAAVLPTTPGLPILPGSSPNPTANAAASATGAFALTSLAASTTATAPPEATAMAALSAFTSGADARGGDDALTQASRDFGVDALPPVLPNSALSGALTSRAVVMLDAVRLPLTPDAGFGDDLGTRVGWMVDQKLGEAQIRVHPEHLGPIDVRIQLDGQRVSADFNSANADVRQALEAGLGRLRDMLGQQGLQLAHAGVGDGKREGQSSGQGASTPTDSNGQADDASTMRASRGLLDEYA